MEGGDGGRGREGLQVMSCDVHRLAAGSIFIY